MPSIFNKSSNREKVDYGINLCLSIPYHKLHLVETMDKRAAETHAQSRSHYVRRLIEEDERNAKKRGSVEVLQFA
jgi:hypothetical protein|tara:strand:+ start:1240 stop:1464 length:225 start_codon:yes stop_codon:yes gene_type:complete